MPPLDVRRFVRANVVRCTRLAPPPAVCVRVEAWVLVVQVWLRRRLPDRLALRAVVPASVMFRVE